MRLTLFVALMCFVVATSEAAEVVRVTDAASFNAAIQSLRDLRSGGDSSPMVIEIAAPLLRPESTIRLDAVTIGYGLTIRGTLDQPPAVLSGSVPMQRIASDKSTIRFRLPGNWGQYGVPRHLIVGGEYQAAARHPNVGTFRIEKTLPDRRSGFTVSTGCLPELFSSEAKHADLVFLHDWSSSRLPLQSYDPQSRELRTVGPIGCEAKHYAIDHFEVQPRFWLEGSRLFADLPGEWWIDRESGEVVMLRGEPKEGAAQDVNVELPLLETLLKVSGEGRAPVKNLRLENLRFQGTRFPFPAGGLACAQATMHEPRDAVGQRSAPGRPMISAAVDLEGIHSAAIRGCYFTALGNTALWLGRESKNCEVRDCKFFDIGGNAINFGENNDRRVDGKPWFQAAPDQVPTANRIENCEITKCGQILPGSVAIWAPLNKDLWIEKNHIVNVPYTAISLGWMWNDTVTPAGGNAIRENTIENPMQLLSDGGGIYTLGRQPNTVIERNTITGIPHASGRAESNGMFFDEGTTGLTIRNNTIRLVAQSPLRFHRAGNNIVEENLWELATPQTPQVRYNNTPVANIELRNNVVIEHPQH